MPNESIQGAAQRTIKYNPQLDGLRFFAVLFVVTYHWVPAIHELDYSTFFGGLINFFFVLSSYLITKILFSARDKAISMGIPKFKVIAVFLLRRVLRIFPAYYLFLLVAVSMPTIGSEIRQHAAMYFSYLANYHMYASHVFPAVSAHIWTLAVEEQFYLVWPLVIMFVPQKHLVKTLLAIIICAVLYRAFTYEPVNGVPQVILTQYCVDAFAVGAVLACKYTNASEKEKQLITRYTNLIFYIGVPLSIFIIAVKSHYWSFVLNRFLFSVISFKIIEGAVVGYKNYFGKFLEKKPVLYIGRISYGIYLYHLLVPAVFWKLYNMAYDFGLKHYAGFFMKNKQAIDSLGNFLATPAMCFIIYAAFTLLIASLSWKWLEMPFNRLKISYNIPKPKPAAAVEEIKQRI